MKNVVLSMSKVTAIALLLLTVVSCSSLNRTMREPDSFVRFEHKDFTYSDQVTAEFTVKRILGIDWKHLFKKGNTASVNGGANGISMANIPVIGKALSDKTANYALYEMMNANPGYDVVFYPQYETTKKGFSGIFTKTTVKVTARLGKLNK